MTNTTSNMKITNLDNYKSELNSGYDLWCLNQKNGDISVDTFLTSVVDPQLFELHKKWLIDLGYWSDFERFQNSKFLKLVKRRTNQYTTNKKTMFQICLAILHLMRQTYYENKYKSVTSGDLTVSHLDHNCWDIDYGRGKDKISETIKIETV